MTMRTSAKRIMIFNHKGGVGKTTLTANIACALAELGKRVLLVDADPQCNLTSYFIEDTVVDDLLDNSDTSKGRTIWSAVKPLVDGVGQIKKIKPYEIGYGRLFLVPGDIQLSDFEEELNDAWTDCFKRKLRGFTTTAALSELTSTLSSSIDADFVFFDSGPNIGPLNRILLLDTDYLVIPAACDLFSLRALTTLGHSASRWIRDWSTIKLFAPDDAYLLPGSPQFLGYIPQRFRVYGGRPTTAFSKLLPRLERAIASQVVERLKEVHVESLPKQHSLKLGQVKDFPIASYAQVQGSPIWKVFEASPQQARESKAIFRELATTIIKRTTSDG